MKATRARSPGDLAVIIIFVALTLTPAILALTGHARADGAYIVTHEQRIPFVAPPPSSGALATGGWERDVEREIADRFPFRTPLVETYDYAKYAWFGGTPTPLIVRGRDSWLFWTMEERRYVTRTWNPSDADLSRLAALYGDRARWCAEHGMRYVFVIAPNKSTVYANVAPPWYRPAAPTPFDRLLPMLRSHGVTTVDVRVPLVAAARTGEVYSRGDTHWNDAGAYVAYRATVAVLHDAGVRDAVAPTGTHIETKAGDLLNMSGVGARISDHVVRLDYPHRAHPIETLPEQERSAAAAFAIHVSAVDDPKLPSAVLIGDSFSAALAPLLAEDFRTTIHLQEHDFFASAFPRPFLLAQKPTVVVQELVERRLVYSGGFRR
ncbi:MAG: hypothetical protein NVS3B7_13610 [Candidatus Elarobacter sp.]